MSVVDQQFNINLYGAGSVLALIALALLCSVLSYRSRSRVGFYLRKRWPISWGEDLPESRKNVADILFIDDLESPVASTLVDDGYRVDTLRDGQVHNAKVKRANIIFVDYKGVGRRISSEQQGLALANAIKNEYGYQKFVILYSAQEFVEPSGNLADAWIKKGVSTAQYADVIKKACFALFA
jgi:hypothetical protein